ncbi:hypothetical protein [Paraflavitalea speifideaquila]|uniref:hypothetical protein n=1 Tax=Paraflavitalea speifideaquila TaxID=3076558 RepID=UPI0028EA7502|nr:hypothetical protein [Paraflavitalea speifideiaquila]
MIVLVTLISIGCNYLLNRLKRKSEEEILSEVMLGGEVSEEEENANFHAKVKSNNWYAFWLQLIPGVFIAGLLILSISLKAHPDSISAINASSEGLIAGTSMAIALAGLIYLYIVKIVEPRLVKKYTANPGVHVNWGRANWELVVVIGIFLLFCICIIAIPYHPEKEFNIIQVDHRTRFSILLFIGVALGGSIAFAYSVRSHGLIETSRLLEVILIRLNDLIARCSAPRSPSLHNGLTEEQGNVVQHVLKQLLFKASLNIANPSAQRVRVRPLTFFEKVAIALKLVDKPKVQDPPPVVPLLPWEEKYFPHLTDEVKAVEFEYRERKAKVQKAEDNIDDHKTARATEQRRYESDIEKCRKNIDEHHSQIRKTLQEKAEQSHTIKNTYHAVITDLQDGFHLGMYYRENGIGPRPGYYDYCAPNGQPAQPLLITSNK